MGNLLTRRSHAIKAIDGPAPAKSPSWRLLPPDLRRLGVATFGSQLDAVVRQARLQKVTGPGGQLWLTQHQLDNSVERIAREFTAGGKTCVEPQVETGFCTC